MAIEESSSKTGSFSVYQKKLYQWNRLKGHVYKGFQECESAVEVSADPLSPSLSTLSTMNTPDNRKDEPDDTEPIPDSRSK